MLISFIVKISTASFLLCLEIFKIGLKLRKTLENIILFIFQTHNLIIGDETLKEKMNDFPKAMFFVNTTAFQ